ncbi:MAG TPA: hypothetical protein VNM22_17445, partial [Candidatus Limnocylindrales bacterium]|nr:hypothetical protein [Candidatus Limnocylindrales bacterium]
LTGYFLWILIPIPPLLRDKFYLLNVRFFYDLGYWSPSRKDHPSTWNPSGKDKKVKKINIFPATAGIRCSRILLVV